MKHICSGSDQNEHSNQLSTEPRCRLPFLLLSLLGILERISNTFLWCLKENISEERKKKQGVIPKSLLSQLGQTHLSLPRLLLLPPACHVVWLEHTYSQPQHHDGFWKPEKSSQKPGFRPKKLEVMQTYTGLANRLCVLDEEQLCKAGVSWCGKSFAAWCLHWNPVSAQTETRALELKKRQPRNKNPPLQHIPSTIPMDPRRVGSAIPAD